MNTFKHISQLSIIATTLITLTACEKEELDLNAALTMEYQAIEVILDPMDATGTMELELAFDGREQLAELLSGQGMSLSNLKEVRVLAAAVSISEPQEADFTALGAFSVELGRPGEDHLAIASVHDVPEQARNVDLIMSQSDLVQYFTSDEVSTRVMLDVRQPIEEQMVLKVDLRFQVVAGTN